MRVLFCSQAAHTGGGVEAWMETLTAALEARGVEVFTALARGRFHDPERYAARHRVANPIAVDGTLGFRESRIAALVDVFRRVKPDVIIPVNLADALLAASYWKTRGDAARLAVCLHGQADDRVEQVRSCAPFVDLAVSVARRAALRLEPVIGEARRVRHIPTGVPPPLHPFRARDRLAHLGLIGRLEQAEKRVFDAVALMRVVDGSGVTLHVAGGGADEARFRDELRGFPVVFHGRLSRDELYAGLYPTLDAIVLFSAAEAGPIVAWEAMIHGVVPIVSDYLGRAEEGVIRDGETGAVFPVGDVARAAEAVRRLSAPGALTELSRRAREELPAAYTLAQFERSWHEALEECMAMPLRRGDTSQLPPLLSSGRLARLGLGVRSMALLRRLARRRYEHADPGSEWPH